MDQENRLINPSHTVGTLVEDILSGKKPYAVTFVKELAKRGYKRNQIVDETRNYILDALNSAFPEWRDYLTQYEELYFLQTPCIKNFMKGLLDKVFNELEENNE